MSILFPFLRIDFLPSVVSLKKLSFRVLSSSVLLGIIIIN